MDYLWHFYNCRLKKDVAMKRIINFTRSKIMLDEKELSSCGALVGFAGRFGIACHELDAAIVDVRSAFEKG